jgi:hypothetical protein
LYDGAQSLIGLWSLKIEKGHGRPFDVGHDFHLATLDIICSVAFGLDEGKETLRREIAHLRSFDPSVPDTDDPVPFPNAPADPEVTALLNLSDMIAIAQSSPFPAISQHLAMLRPKHAKAWWYRRRLVHRQTAKSVKKLQGGKTFSQKCALDQLLWREMCAAEKANRKPDFYSPIIRDEVSTESKFLPSFF